MLLILFKPHLVVQYQDVEVKIDEKTLQDIATVTDGKYFRATNNNKLKEIYKDIDKLLKNQKLKLLSFTRRSEEFLKFAFSCFRSICLLCSFITKNHLF